MEKICTPFGCNPRNIFMQDMFGLHQADAPIQEFSDEYHAILDYATAQGYTKPAYTIQVEQNQLLVHFKTLGIWDKLDVFYNFLTKQSIEDFAKINWKNPNQYYLTKVGGVTYIAKSGFKGAVGGHLNTDYAPGVHYIPNDAGFFADIDAPQVNSMVMGVDDSLNETSLQVVGGSLITAFVNNAVSTYISVPSLSAFFHCYYFNSAINVYANGVSKSQINRLSPLSPVDPFYLLARNNNGVSDNHCTGALACAGIGASLDGVQIDLYNAWVAYKQTIIAIAAYKAITDYATAQGYTLPSQVVQDQGELLIYEYIVSGIWDELDVFYNFYTDGDANFAKINWKNPGVNQITSSGSIPFTALSGFKGNGTNGYLSTNWVPNTGIKFTKDSASMFVGVGNLVYAGIVKGLCGANDINGSSHIYIGTGNVANSSVNATNTVTTGLESIAAMYHAVRGAGNTHALYLNGNVKSSVSNNSTPLSTVIFYVGARNNSGSPANFSNGTSQCFGAGSSITGKQTLLYQHWAYYKTATIARQAWENIINYATSQSYTLPSNRVRDKSLTLLFDLVSSGIWAELDVFYNANTDGDENFARINWKNPGTHQATEGTFVSMQGFDSLNTNWNPSIDGVQYTLNDASIIRDGSAEPNINAKYIYSNSINILTYAMISSNSSPEPHGVIIQDNLYTVQRVNQDEVVLTQQGYNLATFSKPSTAIPNETLKFGSGLIRFAMAGSAMLDKVAELDWILTKYKSRVK